MAFRQVAHEKWQDRQARPAASKVPATQAHPEPAGTRPATAEQLSHSAAEAPTQVAHDAWQGSHAAAAESKDPSSHRQECPAWVRPAPHVTQFVLLVSQVRQEYAHAGHAGAEA